MSRRRRSSDVVPRHDPSRDDRSAPVFRATTGRAAWPRCVLGVAGRIHQRPHWPRSADGPEAHGTPFTSPSAIRQASWRATARPGPRWPRSVGTHGHVPPTTRLAASRSSANRPAGNGTSYAPIFDGRAYFTCLLGHDPPTAHPAGHVPPTDSLVVHLPCYVGDDPSTVWLVVAHPCPRSRRRRHASGLVGHDPSTASVATIHQLPGRPRHALGLVGHDPPNGLADRARLMPPQPRSMNGLAGRVGHDPLVASVATIR